MDATDTIQSLSGSGAVELARSITITTGEGDVDTVIRQIYTSGSNISSMLVDVVSTANGDAVSGGNTVDTVTDTKRFFIDTGSGAAITPDLTLYAGSKYIFDTSGLSGHTFLLSKFTISSKLNVKDKLFNEFNFIISRAHSCDDLQWKKD